MPGVEISTSVRTGPTNPPGPSAAKYMPVGITERGPVDISVRVRSIAEYEAVYGVRTSYSGNLYDSVACYFEEGGSEAWIARVVGAAAVKASLTINNRLGSPVATFKVTALNPGAYAAELTAQIADGTAGTVTLTLRRTGTVVETYANKASVAELVAALAASSYVRGADLGGGGVAGSTALPAVTAATPLAGGADDRATVDATAVVAAANLVFTKALGPGAVAAPGYTVAQVGAGLIAHCKTNRRVALLAAAVDADNTALKAAAASIVADGRYAGLFAPWVRVPDGSTSKLISPEGYVAATRSVAMSTVGIWKVPAGNESEAKYVIGTSPTVDQTSNNDLASGYVSGLTTYANRVRLFGWYSLDTDRTQFALLRDQDFLNGLSAMVEAALDPFVWEVVDGRGELYSQIQGVVVGILQPIADAGGVYPLLNPDSQDEELDPGYSVSVSATTTQLAENAIGVAIGVRLSPAAATIYVNIVKSNLTAAVSV